MTAPDIIAHLIERFERNRDDYRSDRYNETQLRREFLDPFFDALGYPIYRYYYDPYGNQIGILDPLGRVTVMEYDSQNRLIRKYQPYHVAGLDDLSDSAVFPAWSTLVTNRPGNQPFEGKSYNPLGRILAEQDYAGNLTAYWYYATWDTGGRAGQLSYKRHYKNNSPAGQIPTWDYTESHPTKGANPEIHYTYDILGRTHEEIVNAYNATGDDGTLIDGPNTWTTHYDNEGRVSILESPQGDLLYQYDAKTGAKIATTSYPAAMTPEQIRTDAAPGQNQYAASITRTVYTYDDLGRSLTAQVTRRNGAALTEAATTYGYNDNGSRESVKLPNGVYTQYQYNGMNRLTEVVNYQAQPQNGQPLPITLSRFGYAHYADGQRATAGEMQKPATSGWPNVEKSLTCKYDGLNRLTYESNYENSESAYGYRAKYTQDLAGNRTERRVEVTNASGTSTLTTQYAYYTGTDRLQTETNVNNLSFVAIPWGQDRMYAYASPEGSLSYGLPGSVERIGSFGAFVAGLPSVWNRYAMMLLAALLPLAAFGPMLAQVWRRMRGTVTDGPRPTLSLYHRCLCVLFAYIFLIGPENFQSLASAEIQYSALSTATWGQSGRTIEYGYDTNGAQIRKTTKITSTQQVIEELRYDYTLRGQLQRVVDTNKTWDTLTDDKTAAEYRYNPSGIRVGKTEYVNGVATTRTDYLIDPYNPTGYAQVLQETEWNITNPSSPLPVTRTDYALGDDVISQTKSTYSGGTWTAGQTECLLYDGHGSTRQLSGSTAGVSDNFSYDAYGMMLGGNPTPAVPGPTKYLYAGEQYDKSLGHYYLRARYYNPSNGRFNQTDPFAGNPSDPQSLHKYLYCHANPVNNIDPSGRMTIAAIAFDAALVAMMISMLLPACRGAYKQAKAIANRANCSNIFTAIFKGAVTLNDFKEILSSFGKGGWAGTINILDAISFRQIDPFHEYRDSLWQSEGLDESWVGSASNVFAWIGTTALYSAIALWTWSVLGGGTMDIAVSYTSEPGVYFHVQYGANGIWEEALGAFGRMPIQAVDAGEVEGALFEGIPVLYPEAVIAGSGRAYSCLVAALHALGRGWGLRM